MPEIPASGRCGPESVFRPAFADLTFIFERAKKRREISLTSTFDTLLESISGTHGLSTILRSEAEWSLHEHIVG